MQQSKISRINSATAFIKKLLVLSALIISVGQAMAKEDYSTVVNVDLTDVNAATAKEKAMAQANRTALNNLAPEFTGADGVQMLNSLSEDQIIYFIKDATVLSEKSSDVRYIASLKITIQDDILRQYLQEKGFVEDRPLNSINGLYHFDNLAEWLKVAQDLSNLKPVNSIDEVAMIKGKVQFKLEYYGDFEQLQSAIINSGLTIRNNGSVYIISKSGFNSDNYEEQ